MASEAGRRELREALSRSVCRVTFTKVDGTIRTMPCTLREDIIPPATRDDPVTQKRTREVSDAVMVVYCTDKQAWRSFRVDNVIGVEEIDGDGR